MDCKCYTADAAADNRDWNLNRESRDGTGVIRKRGTIANKDRNRDHIPSSVVMIQYLTTYDGQSKNTAKSTKDMIGGTLGSTEDNAGLLSRAYCQRVCKHSAVTYSFSDVFKCWIKTRIGASLSSHLS